MRQIYSRARKVFCWVGQSSDPPLLKLLIQNTASDTDGALVYVEDERRIIEDFFREPYWDRVWIIQEIAVATELIVLWGARCEQTAQKPSSLKAEWTTWNLVAKCVINLTQSLKESKSGQGLSVHLPVHLGLCQDGLDLVPVPNYKQSLEAILTDMSRTMMRRNHSLDLLAMRGVGTAVKSDLPTWVPDWPRIWSQGMSLQESKFEQWRTSFPSNPVLDGSFNDTLKIHGVSVSRIIRVCAQMQNSFDLEDEHFDAYWLYGPSRRKVHVDERNKEEVLRQYDTIWKTLTMSTLPHDFPIEASRSCLSVLWTPEGRGASTSLALIKWIDSSFDFKYVNRTLRDWSQLNLEQQGQHTAQQLNTFLAAMSGALRGGLRLASTTSAGVHGLIMTDLNVQPGDSVWKLSGCSIHVVLRQVTLPPTANALARKVLPGKEVESGYHVIGGVYYADGNLPWDEFDKAPPESWPILTLY